MSKYHYVYHSYEEWGREYIGVRSCNCLPEEDTKYFGSFYDKTFKPTEKTILFVCETRKKAAEIEIKLHDFFDVAVNPKFANRAKAISTGFGRAGVLHAEETKRKISESLSGEKNPRFGVPNKTHSERMTGEKNPMYGRTGEKAPHYGKFGALNHTSKAIIAIKLDGTESHFGSVKEAARKLKIDSSSLSKYARNGHVLTQGKFRGWRFIYKNSEVLN